MFTAALIAVAMISTVTHADRGRERPEDEPAIDGCPGNSVQVVTSPDGSTVTVLFDRFVAEAGESTGKRAAHVACRFEIPVTVPSRMSAAVYEIDYRGFNSLPKGARSEFQVEYAVRSGKEPNPFRKGFGDKSGDFIVTDKIPHDQMKWTGCGTSFVMGARAALLLESNRSMEFAMSSLDSVDGRLGGGLRYRIKFRECR